MKTASTALKASLLSDRQFTPVELFEIALVDGTNLYYTSFDFDVKFTGMGPRSGRVYSRRPIQRSNLSQKRGVQATRFTLSVLNDPANIDVAGRNLAQSMLAGRWIGATITWLRAQNPVITPGLQAQVSEAVTMLYGRAGKASPVRNLVQLDVNSPLELLNMDLPWRILGHECRWTLFDANCGISKAAFAGPGTVLAGSTRSQILAALGNVTGYFDQGTLTWLTGQNAGLTASIQSFLGSGLASSYPNLVLADKPVAYYRLNANVSDSGSGAYNGVNHGATFSTSGGPLAGGSGYASFDGSVDWIDISAIPDPRSIAGKKYLGGVSFEFFFYSAATRQPNGAFGSGATDQRAGLWNFASDTQTYPGFRWGHNHPFAAFNPSSSAWHHCVVVFRGQRYLDVYLNGYLFVTTSDAGDDKWDWTAPTIGKAVLPNSYSAAGGNTQWYNGRLAEFVIYAYPMDAGQVLAHYNASQVNPASLVSAELNLLLPALYPPAAGDTFTAYPGDSKSMRSCAYKFDNLDRFGGAPFIPPANQSG